ncbi:MAG: putative pyrophosphatase [Candidatus Saccharibacteria bacterium]|nr:putative pyrophosphatase [Candidatus Saccharibacteria bacterium]
MSVTQLKDNPTLSEIQAYIAGRTKERGFDKETTQDSFMLLVEEVGELAKALRPLHGIKTAVDSTQSEVEHEAADVFWLLVCICNGLNIDLETALRSKETKNLTRTWQ